MYNIEKIIQIQNIIMYKKFDIFILKYQNVLDKIDIRKEFLKEFNIKTEFSEEYILFLNYLIKEKYDIKN